MIERPVVGSVGKVARQGKDSCENFLLDKEEAPFEQ
jgi:hypothetical protein